MNQAKVEVLEHLRGARMLFEPQRFQLRLHMCLCVVARVGAHPIRMVAAPLRGTSEKAERHIALIVATAASSVCHLICT